MLINPNCSDIIYRDEMWAPDVDLCRWGQTTLEPPGDTLRNYNNRWLNQPQTTNPGGGGGGFSRLVEKDVQYAEHS